MCYLLSEKLHQRCGVLIFSGTPTPGLENLGLRTSLLSPAIKNTRTPTKAIKKYQDSDSGLKIRLQLRLQDLLCDILTVYLRMTATTICVATKWHDGRTCFR